MAKNQVLQKFYFNVEDCLGNPKTSGLSIHVLDAAGAAVTLYKDAFAAAHSYFSGGFMKESNFATLNGDVEFWCGAPSVNLLILNKRLEGMFVEGVSPSANLRIPFVPQKIDRFVIELLDDFVMGNKEDGNKFSSTADKGQWLLTIVDGDTDGLAVCQVQDDAAGGILACTTNNKTSDSNELQVNGESFKLAAGKPAFFEIKAALDDIDKADFFAGLAITDTTVLAGVTDSLGFQNDHDGNLDCLVNKNSTASQSDSTVDIADGTLATFATKARRMGFYFDGGSKVEFSIDGTLVITKTDDGSAVLIPDDEALTPTLALKTTAAQTVTAWVDYLIVRGVK